MIATAYLYTDADIERRFQWVEDIHRKAPPTRLYARLRAQARIGRSL